MPLRIYVADDQPMFRLGLSLTLERDGCAVIGTGASGRDVLRALRAETPPDVAVMDLMVSDLTGVEVAHCVEKEGLRTKILLLTAGRFHDLIYEAMEAGVAGFLPKTAEPSELCHAVREIERGAVIVPPEVMATLQTRIKRKLLPQQDPLTTREREVLALLSQGLSVPKIARRLGITPHTVKGYVRHCFEKLDVHNQPAAVAKAIRKGYIK